MTFPVDPNAPALASDTAGFDIRELVRNSDNGRAVQTKFRLLKARLRSHMVFVDQTLAQLDHLGRANVVTKEDLRMLREVRDLLHDARAQGLELKAEADG